MTAREVFERHRGLARRIAGAYLKRLPGSISRMEIHTVALGGLWDVALRYHELPEEEFEGVAIVRVRGAITDHLRKADDFSRYARDRADGVVLRMVRFGSFGQWESVLAHDGQPIDLEGDLDGRRRARWVREACRDLPDQQRLVVGKILAGKTQREISLELALSQARICQVVRLAEQSLRARWAETHPAAREHE
jgi:RNA polymerase sigma factor (sigma-70 family)